MVRTRLAVYLSIREMPLVLVGFVIGAVSVWAGVPEWAAALATSVVAVDVRLRLEGGQHE
ncbi:hypothetical protein [Streptomyces sp. NPDC000880]